MVIRVLVEFPNDFAFAVIQPSIRLMITCPVVANGIL